MDLPRRHFSKMTADEVLAAKKGGWICVLPLGATEQHGPHLPLQTDTIIAEGFAARAIAFAPENLPVTFLPAEPIGYSPEHMEFAGGKTLAFDEAVERWVGIGANVAARGIRKFVMLNAHGGNSPLMTVVATELRIRHSILAVATSWTRFAQPEGLISANEKAFGIHGGLAETSIMLALRPELVDMAKAKDFSSAQQEFAKTFSHLRAYGPHAFGWKMSDLSREGVTGNAAAASAELGNALLNNAARGFIELLEDVDRFDLERLV